MTDLNPAAIQAGLATRRLGRRLEVWADVTSTMDRLAELAAAGAPDGTVVIADRQTAGRGRFQRPWLAPAGTALLMSVLFRPELPPARVAQVPMALALGLLDGLAACAGCALPIGLKWPNDLVWRDLKLAGLLAEAMWGADGVAEVRVGLGLNVHQAPDALPPGAASLAMVLDRVPGRAPLATAILNATEGHYAQLLATGDLVPAWAARLVTLGQLVTAWSAEEPVHGLATGVTADGGLVIQRAEGSEVVVHAGDVTLRAPAGPTGSPA
jgi:BirA family transcriptional regulator, biotin operon repressor / biotin---[acetyl-CoA-carboxylase] ligase